MSSFKVVAIPTEVAESVRNTLKAPGYGFPVHKEMAAGRAPCRHCLKLIRVQEEESLLFTYDAFHQQGVPPLPGPVYLHAKECARHPGSASFPPDYRGRLLTLNAYGADRAPIEEVRVANSDEQAQAERLFANPLVEYVHVRSTEAGCYLFRLERN